MKVFPGHVRLSCELLIFARFHCTTLRTKMQTQNQVLKMSYVQWVGFKEKDQENPIFHWKIFGFL